MSEPQTDLVRSALEGAGFEAPDVSLRELGPVGMVTIRGDFASDGFAGAVKTVTGFDLPETRRFVGGPEAGLGWMSPDELLYVCAYGDAPGAATALSEALAEAPHLAINVSDARAAFRVRGAGARELIAKGAPVDMSPEAFGPGDLRRSRLGQVAAAFWFDETGEAEGLTIVCFRSLADYVFEWLKASAKDGARPGLY